MTNDTSCCSNPKEVRSHCTAEMLFTKCQNCTQEFATSFKECSDDDWKWIIDEWYRKPDVDKLVEWLNDDSELLLGDGQGG